MLLWSSLKVGTTLFGDYYGHRDAIRKIDPNHYKIIKWSNNVVKEGTVYETEDWDVDMGGWKILNVPSKRYRKHRRQHAKNDLASDGG